MMQSCCHCGETCFSRAHDFQPHSLFLILAGLVLSDTTGDSQMQVRGIRSLLSQAIRVTGALPGQRERSRPRHDMTEGIMTSTYDMRSEATLFIGLSKHALQRQTRILYELTRQVLHWHSIGWSPIKSMTQAK